MTIYYSWFIPAFAELTSPLTDLTGKSASGPIQWTEQCQMAFENVNKAHSWGSAPIYTYL